MLRVGRWWLLAGLVVVLDQWGKALVMNHLGAGETVRLTAWFNLVLAYNSGAAFSFLAGAGGWQRVFFSALAGVAVLVVGFLIRRHAQETGYAAGLALIMGGAAGNLVDRLREGVVTDFIQWHVGNHFFPAFNLADSAITLGVALLIWDSSRHRNGSR